MAVASLCKQKKKSLCSGTVSGGEKEDGEEGGGGRGGCGIRRGGWGGCAVGGGRVFPGLAGRVHQGGARGFPTEEKSWNSHHPDLITMLGLAERH